MSIESVMSSNHLILMSRLPRYLSGKESSYQCRRPGFSPWDSNEIKPVNPKEINPEYSLEGLMLKLKLQHFGHLMPRTNSFEKTLILGQIEGGRRRG